MRPGAKTLIILSPGFAVSEQDSTCLPAQQSFVLALNRHRPDLQVVIFAFEYPFPAREYHWHQNRVISFGKKKRGRISRLSMWRRVWGSLKEINEKEEVLGLLSFWCTETALLGKTFAKKYRLKHYCWILGQDARKGNRMIRLIRPSPGELIAMSDSLAAEFLRNYGVNPQYIVANGIDPGSFPETDMKRDVDICGSGSLIPLKQYDIFVRVIETLAKDMPGINAMLCGSGKEEPALRESIRLAGMKERIRLTREIEHGQVLTLMRRTRVFLHPSSYEGFSTACLEALFAGAHVVSFCQPMNYSIDHWHVVSNEGEMVKKTLSLLKDPALDHSPVLANSISSSAKQIMLLFN
ncbi:MAG TPA: glycosyltransferase [Puia sp.]|nr:glycosyltransferase [Puia sp.]